MNEHANHLNDAADTELCGDLSILMGAYADRGICGGCLLKAAVTHLLGVAHARHGPDFTLDIIEGGRSILEEVEAETEPPRMQ